MNIAWSGLSDYNYWTHIASLCVPSWKNLPGDKFLITDEKKFLIDGVSLIDWNDVANVDLGFPVNFSQGKKQTNFWRKMKSQIWAIKNLKKYDWVILLDADIEIYKFDDLLLEKILLGIKEKNVLWSVGKSLEGVDAGFIIIDMAHNHLDNFFKEYEAFWEEGHILNLKNAYDGNVIEEMTKKYEPIFVPNIKIGPGQYYYEVGLYHWGSKDSKPIRKNLINSSEYIMERLKKI
jgi:hypothetical protein